MHNESISKVSLIQPAADAHSVCERWWQLIRGNAGKELVVGAVIPRTYFSVAPAVAESHLFHLDIAHVC